MQKQVDHAGHRRRLIQKIESNVLLEHEYLEILLFSVLPRRNTNDLAHRLMAEFGTLSAVFKATMPQLQTVEGVGENIAAFIRCVGLVKMNAPESSSFPKFFKTGTFSAFVKAEYEKHIQELLDIYFLNSEGAITGRKRFTAESAAHVTVEPHDVSRLIVEHKPSGIVLVHNHPFGEAKPSALDDDLTGKCQLICNFNNVLLCDHLIYSPEGVYSYYQGGRLTEISNEYALQNLLKGKGGEK